MRKEQQVGLDDYFQGIRRLIRIMGIVTGLEVSDRRVSPETVEQVLKESEDLRLFNERDVAHRRN